MSKPHQFTSRSKRMVAVAMANKTVRIIWPVLTREEIYRPAAT